MLQRRARRPAGIYPSTIQFAYLYVCVMSYSAHLKKSTFGF